MKTRMRRIVGTIFILIGVMMVIKNEAAYAANREPMKDYERVLLSEGFVQSEDDETIWSFNGTIDGYKTTAFYDAYYDSGAMYMVDEETGEISMYTFKWQPSELEFEGIAEIEF